MSVIEFEDQKFVPLPPVDPLRNYTSKETRGAIDSSDIKPLQIIQPEGPSFHVNGYFIEWQKVIHLYHNFYFSFLIRFLNIFLNIFYM